MKKLNRFLAVFLVLLAINIVSVSLFIARLARQNKSEEAFTRDAGRIQVEVKEANTNRPVDNATVCIIETRHYETTDKYGLTSLISVPILKNENFNLSLEQTWGEVTILVYKNGYADSINFYTSILPGATRLGVIVYLTPIISDDDLKPSVEIERPNDAWIERLIKLYKKRV